MNFTVIIDYDFEKVIQYKFIQCYFEKVIQYKFIQLLAKSNVFAWS